MAGGTVVVFGAAGHVGGVLADRLLAAGRKVRGVGRSAGRLEGLARRGAEIAIADVTEAASVERAMQGAEAAFLLIPPPSTGTGILAYQSRAARALSEAAQKAHLSRVVLLSSIGADQASGSGPIVGVRELEGRLAQIPGLSALFLRPGYFFENHL